MKAHLLFPDRDIDLQAGPPAGADDLSRDLALDSLFAAMGAGDPYLRDLAQRVVLSSLNEPGVIRYRQRILADCIRHSEVIRRLYQVAVSAIEGERRVWRFTLRQPEGLLHRCAQVLGLFAPPLRELRAIADTRRGDFQSDGFAALFALLAREIDDVFLHRLADHLRRLEFRAGLLMSARLGQGNQGAHYHIRKPLESTPTVRERVEQWVHGLIGGEASSLVYELHDRDESGFQALAEIRNRGIAPVAAALAASTAHILDFFKMLRAELGFYVGCLNLRERLTAKGERVCFPDLAPDGQGLFRARGLYDMSLSLSMEGRVVGSDVKADRQRLVMITGANRGGKTTFLRGVGIAQLLMQCGAFVPAEEYRASVCKGVFTHFRREEDPNMRHGKLDEELSRMSAIVDRLTPGSLVLLNESFASTNEREGSEIARQITRALLESGVKVVYVTHLFDLAESLFHVPPAPALFLRAERLPDGRRTFKLLQGEPLPTSHGADIYAHVFGGGSAAVRSAVG